MTDAQYEDASAAIRRLIVALEAITTWFLHLLSLGAK